MAPNTDPYGALLNEIGNPVPRQKLLRTIRGVLESCNEWEEKIPELVQSIKDLAPGGPPKLSDTEVQVAWDERFSNLTREAAAMSIRQMKGDPFVALRRATGDVIPVNALQKMFRGLWDRRLLTWYGLSVEVREKLFNDILGEISQTRNVIPSGTDERRLFNNRILELINKAGEKSWQLMKRSTAKLKRDKKVSMRRAGNGEGAAGQISDHCAPDEAGETGEAG